MPSVHASFMLRLPLAQVRPELELFVDWVRQEAARTRLALGEAHAVVPTTTANH